MRGVAAIALALATAGLLSVLGCRDEHGARGADASDASEASDTAPAAEGLPSILWIVWDTVRARDLDVYGYSKPTTPFVQRWSREARVFDDVVSAATTTVPSHASMFTGLLPSQHGATNQNHWLPPGFVTIAQLLHDRGYATYLYSANPMIRAETGFGRGFDRVEHPWSPELRTISARIARWKVSRYRSPRPPDLQAAMKSASSQAQAALEAWLDTVPPDRPFFAFLNYMDAHAPCVPDERYRERFLSPSQVSRSYAAPVVSGGDWSYSLGLSDMSADDLAVLRGIYDAALAELDDRLRILLASLEQRGRLENTVVVLTADHGELLGEHHMLDHQFSIYEELLRVPLIVWGPGRIDPGRETRPVTTMDLFPTLLELAGATAPPDRPRLVVSLLAPQVERPRLSEYPSAANQILAMARVAHPDFDPTHFAARLRALRVGSWKYVWSSDGRNALYDLGTDPGETRDRIDAEPETARQIAARLDETLDAAGVSPTDAPPAPPKAGAQEDAETREMLRALGYSVD